jgi:hypothetical protein
MKSKVLKFGLPIGAFMLAIGFAFATESKASEKEAFVTGYIFQAGQCRPAPKDCNNISATPCTYLGNQVWSVNNGTSCATMLFHNGL